MALLCWSGGCDSTLLLYKLLKSGNKNVRTISFNHHAVAARFQNRTARGAILKWLSEHGLEVKEHTELNISAECGGAYDNPDGLGQPTIWQFNALTYLKKNENLYLGYIKSDCVWHYRTQLYDVFQKSCYLMHYEGQLMAPLEWDTKADVIRQLTDVGLDKLVWWCEGHRGGISSKPCGNCSPCKEVAAAKFLLSNDKKEEIEPVYDKVDQDEFEEKKEETLIEKKEPTEKKE